MVDEYILKGAKRKLIDHLKAKGIVDELVLRSFDTVERHLFFQETFLLREAYEDKALPIGCQQTISAPSTVAFQSQLLQIAHNDRVMEIGTGSGFQAAILRGMGAKVYSIERQAELYQQTRALFSRLQIDVALFFGDGFKGLPQYAPFDKIIVTCGASNIPETLLQQLKVNGIMVIPVGDEKHTMKRVIKTAENSFDIADFGDFCFVPMLKSTVYLNW